MTLKLGIIGGSGLYNFAELENKKTLITKPGPFGKASGDIEYGKIDGVEIFFYHVTAKIIFIRLVMFLIEPILTL